MRTVSISARMLLCLLVGVLGGWMVTAAPALALEERTSIEPAFGVFAKANGIAVDQSNGNVYVVDGGGDEKVQVFGPEGGAPVGGGPSSFDGSGTPSKAFDFKYEPAGPAVAGGKVYLPDVQNNLIEELSLNGLSEYGFACEITGFGASGPSCLGGAGSGSKFGEPLGVALDSSGDLYIGDYKSAAIYELNPSGEQIQSFESPLLGSPKYLAVDSTGDIYAESYGGGGRLVEFKRSSPTGVAEETAQIAEGLTGIAVDNATHRVLIDLGNMAEELDAEHKIVGTFGAGRLSEGLGIAVNEATNVVYIATSSGIRRFGNAVVLPDVTTGSASGVHRTNGTVEGTINPDGTDTTYHFQYGDTLGYGSSTAVASAGKGTAGAVVKETLTGLQPETVYHYRLVGENENGTNFGEDATFETPGAVEGVVTGAASSIFAAEAVLHGSFEPNGFDTHWSFEYGLSEAYGSSTPALDAGDASEDKGVEVTVADLEPNSTYHYRIAAANETGTSYGVDKTFTTSALPPLLEGSVTASNATRSSVVLHATVDTKHSSTNYFFSYVEDGEYEPTAPDPYGAGGATAPSSIASGLGGQPVEELLSGLKPNTLYHYAVVAINPAGRVIGADATFTTGASTPAVALTGGSSGVEQNSATIGGVVNTSGLPTAYGFEVGTTTDYGPPTGLGSVGAGASEAVVSLALTGLQPGTTYHYRLTATNVDGTSYGVDQTFTTGVFANTFAEPPAPLPFVAVPLFAFPSEQKAGVVKKKVKAKPKKAKKHGKAKGKKKTKNKKKR